MRKIYVFVKKVINKIIDDDLFLIANNLTYRLLFAIFPFMIFLMSLVGLFNIDSLALKEGFFSTLPNVVYEFIGEVASVRSQTLLPVSLALTVYVASNGTRAAIRGINTFYHLKKSRGFIREILVSLALVLFLGTAMAVSTSVLIFGTQLAAFLIPFYGRYPLTDILMSIAGVFLSSLLIGIIILLVYKISINKKTAVKNLFPGTAFTLFVWIAASKLFNIFIENFTNFTRFYGGIAGIIVLLYWLNIISTSLLMGAEINAVLFEEAEAETETRQKLSRPLKTH